MQAYELTDNEMAAIFAEQFSEDYAPHLMIDGLHQTESYLCIVFNSRSLHFKIFSNSANPDCDSPQKQSSLKLSEIAEEANTYIQIIKDMSDHKIHDLIMANDIRSQLHKDMSGRIIDKIKEIGGSFEVDDSEDLSLDFGRDIVTCWFNTIGYCEQVQATKPHPIAGSFKWFYQMERQQYKTSANPAQKPNI